MACDRCKWLPGNGSTGRLGRLERLTGPGRQKMLAHSEVRDDDIGFEFGERLVFSGKVSGRARSVTVSPALPKLRTDN